MSAVRSGQITVAAADTSVPGPAAPDGTVWALKAHPANTGVVWVGDDGTDAVRAATGLPLQPGEGIVLRLPRLAALRFAADVAGDRVCWLKLG